MKGKSLRKKILFFLAFIFDLYQELSIKNYYRRFYLPGYDYHPTTLTQTFSRMSKVREIEKIKKNGKVYLRLGAAGGKFLDEFIPLKRFQKKKWDNKWRILIFDIEEKSRLTRDLLRKKLKELGFAKWQKSVYVTPHPIENELNEYLEEKNLSEKCVCFSAQKLGEQNNKELAYRIFNLEEIEINYFEILHSLKELEIKIKNQKSNKKELAKNFQDLVDKFEEILIGDPFLPKELLPKDWPVDKIRNKIKKLFIMFS